MKVSLRAPRKDSHKGENGRLLIIGGSKAYHGAAVLAILAARRFVDLVYFYPGEKDPYLLNAIKAIPEVIVVNDLKILKKIDCVLFGVGLGRAKFDVRKLKTGPDETQSVSLVHRTSRRSIGYRKLVIDADGLKLFKGRIPEGAILTPHGGEFKALFDMEGTQKNVKAMAKKHKCIILKKGPVDIMSDGKKVVKNIVHNPGMTKGGTGDVLAGLAAALACKNNSFKAVEAAAWLAGNAGNRLKKRYGYNFCSSDLAEELAKKR